MGLPAVRRRASAALGCDVYYLEDTGQWLYDPGAQTFTDDARRERPLPRRRRSRASTRRSRDALGAPRPDGTLPRPRRGRRSRASAPATDLFLNLSGSCWLREPYRAARVKAYVDTDPGYSQAKIAAVDAGTADESTRFSVDLIRRHDVFFTLAEHVGRARLPHPDLRPHVASDAAADRARQLARARGARRRRSRPSCRGRSSRRRRRSAGASTAARTSSSSASSTCRRGRRRRLEVALSGAAPRERIAAAGWRLARRARGVGDDGRPTATTSLGVARRAARSRRTSTSRPRSGWFSTRSAAYLACGKPVVVQDTGFSAHVPTGPGPPRLHDRGGGGRRARRDPRRLRARLPRTRARVAEAHFARRARLRPAARRRGALSAWRASSSPATSSAIRSAATPGRRRTTSSGLRALGHDVWFYEDTGHYAPAYNPHDRRVRAESYDYGVARRRRRSSTASASATAGSSSTPRAGVEHGPGAGRAATLLREADLLVNVAGVNRIPPERRGGRPAVYVDIDPAYTQIRAAAGRRRPRAPCSTSTRSTSRSARTSARRARRSRRPATPGTRRARRSRSSWWADAGAARARVHDGRHVGRARPRRRLRGRDLPLAQADRVAALPRPARRAPARASRWRWT